MVLDTSKNPLKHMELLLHQVYMPLLCGDSAMTHTLGLNADRLLDVSHRLMGQLEMIRGHVKGLSKTTPSAALTAAVIHVLESTVIGWIKQVKVVLKHDPLAELQKHGPGAGVYQEEAAWEKHIQNLHSLNAQLDSEKAREILTNLEQANSTYALSFQNVCKDIDKSHQKLKRALKICAAFRGTYLDVKAKADEINSKKVEENIQHISRKPSDSLWSAKLYGPLSAKFTSRGWEFPGRGKGDGVDEWVDCPWPPHGAKCFQRMNLFMERCNDVLELVETIRHFQLLETASEIGGAGTASLDAMVREIQDTYKRTIHTFTSQNSNILSADKNQSFEKAFFNFRTTMKELEFQIAEVLRSSFQQCPTINSQLRLLQVFEGMCSRELVQEHLKDKYEQLLSMFIEELTQEPMVKLKEITPHSLKGDLGWKLRHLYTEVMDELKSCEKETIDSWLKNSQVDLSNALKRPLLVASNVYGELEDQLQAVELNLDPDLLLLLREASYLRKAPFNFSLLEPVETLLKNVDVNRLKSQAVRLEAVVCKYNEVTRTINDYERRLLERKLSAAEELLQSGLTVHTWSMEESVDFIELATSLVCSDLYMTFSSLRSNCREILDRSSAWSNGNLDIFSSRDTQRTYSMEELIQEQETLEHSLERQIFTDGQRIHNLIKESFVAVGVSEASPAWQEYVEHIDILVLQGLKEVTFSSLASMLSTLLEGQEAPILRIRVELVGSAVEFCPPLDESAVQSSVLEHTRDWLKSFLLRGSLVTMLCFSAQGGYHDYIAADKEVIQLVGHILEQVQDSADKCQDTLGVLNQYAYLWKKDVNATFQDFIHGVGRVKSANQSWFSGADFLMDLIDTLSDRSQSRQSSNLRSQSTLLIEAERAFIQPEDAKETISVPLLEDFDAEISIYRNDRDTILTFQDSMVLGWIQVDFQPIKQVLAAYAFKWMWTFAKYLTDKVTATLKKLDAFLKRTEPQIEIITGEERDTVFFMTMIQLFNEVSTKQTEMEGQFIVMQKALKLLEKYEMKLPAESERLFKATPGRWNILRTKVSLAKQRLSPKIRQESESITKDLSQFGERLHQLREAIDESDIYTRACSIEQAYCAIKTFSKQVKSLQREAKDLKELQELLEATVVDFSVLNECHHTVRNLTLLWQKVEVIQKQQTQWKTQPWQDMDTVQLINNTNEQLQIVQSLPREVRGWDIYAGILESVNVIQLTLPLIEDLLNPAMRTRHWKQLVRLTGGQLYITPENIRRMTLADLITLGLQRHADNVKTIVDRAVKDVTIESGLKTCEEVWLSRIFDMHPHCRVTSATGREEVGPTMLLNHPEVIFEELEHHQMTLETMKNNSEAGSFLDEVTKWQKKLQVIESVVRLWSQVQEKWVQLEEVFWTDDVCRDLPKEAATFAAVHQDLRAVMKATEQNPNVLQTCTKQGLQDMLGEMNEKLEKCQNALLHNLEQRRIAFPRFFFLPLQDTLKIVFYAHNPDVLNRYLYKVFEHMESLIFETNNEINKDGSQIIIAVQSFQGEQLYLPEPLECKGPIENWLELLVRRIRTALQHHLHAALGHELLPQRQIHSAGARRVSVSKPASKQRQGGKRDILPGLGSSSLRTLERKESGSLVVQQQDVSSSKSQRETWILATLS
ncbi:dynein beta chain, flagellar outer arm-like [Polyodon spathula]|uniref:dynein beta chain, flagellar outer arm-like n=1 Tax=Polyodon spathula TaxID=7913 RepID=UPI001B7DC0E2|nr:dynein beta chain, flagellar outer arm-like [Polyodon spathula]